MYLVSDGWFVLFVNLPGEKLAWKLIKFHALTHMVHHIMAYGWIENCKCQAGEHLHKFYLKILKRLTNNKSDWQRQIFQIHQRQGAMREIVAEIGLLSCVLHILGVCCLCADPVQYKSLCAVRVLY